VQETAQKSIVEGLIFAADEPISAQRLQELVSTDEISVTLEEIQRILDELQVDYEARGIELKCLASGYQFRVQTVLAPWLQQLWEEKPPRYSRALLETLALIAYRQPITRGEIEAVRGVAVSSHIIKTLLEREWIRVVGYKDVPGKPALLSTTKVFLDYFNLCKLSDLPALVDVSNLEQVGEQLELTWQSQKSAAEGCASERTEEAAIMAEGQIDAG